MKTITILNGIEKFLKEDFTSSQDFEDAKKGISDFDVKDSSESYIFTYMYEKESKVFVSVEKWVNVPVNGQMRWFRDNLNSMTEASIESFFRIAFFERMAEVIEEEAEKANEYMPDEEDVWEEKEFNG